EKVTEFMLCAGLWTGGKDTCGHNSPIPVLSTCLLGTCYVTSIAVDPGKQQ
ncbi:KLK2 isoform 22, partial [Pan troglodytes]